MHVLSKNEWLYPASIAQAKESQHEMAKNILLKDSIQLPFSFIAGMDVSNNRFDPGQMLFASSVLLSYPTLNVVQTGLYAEKQRFPYIPGLLGFREAPVLVQAFQQLTIRPDIIMVDGHGISHPRGLGIASQLGLLLDIPTIGVAKSILVGKPEQPLAEEAGSQTSLIWKGKTIGMLVRTKRRCLPLIVSAGHKITLETAIEVVTRCLKGYRLPEPTRNAHLAANRHRRTSRKI